MLESFLKIFIYFQMVDFSAIIVSILVVLISVLILRHRYFQWKDKPCVKNRHDAFRKLVEKKRVTLVSNVDELSTAWDEFASEMRDVVGLDCEWTTTDEVVGPISLLQMALPTGKWVLIFYCF